MTMPMASVRTAPTGWTVLGSTTATVTWRLEVTASPTTANYVVYDGWGSYWPADEAQWARANEYQETRPPRWERNEYRGAWMEIPQWPRRVQQDRPQMPTPERREAAHARSRELLESILSPAQLETAARGYVDITGSDGDRYRIELDSHSGNVVRMEGPEGDQRRDRWCAHGPAGLPLHDHHVQQILVLETDADAFRRRANRHVDYRGDRAEAEAAMLTVARSMIGDMAAVA